jgi:hypothetical protein
MTEKKAPEPKKTFVTIDGEEYETVEVPYGGKTYTIRELSVDENDDIETAATDKDNVLNGRLNLRMSLMKAIVSPPTGMDDIGKWGGRKYLVMSRAFNKINSLQEDAAGNS